MVIYRLVTLNGYLELKTEAPLRERPSATNSLTLGYEAGLTEEITLIAWPWDLATVWTGSCTGLRHLCEATSLSMGFSTSR